MKILCKLGLHSYPKEDIYSYMNHRVFSKKILILHPDRDNKGTNIIYYQCYCKKCGRNSIRIYPRNVMINFYNHWKIAAEFFGFIRIKRYLHESLLERSIYEPLERIKKNEILENRIMLLFFNFEIEILYKPHLRNPNSPIKPSDIKWKNNIKFDEYLTREEYEKRFRRYLNK